MIVVVPWRENEDDAKMDEIRHDGQGLQGKAVDGRTCSSTEESVRST